jgi:hypothetical protein
MLLCPCAYQKSSYASTPDQFGFESIYNTAMITGHDYKEYNEKKEMGH